MIAWLRRLLRRTPTAHYAPSTTFRDNSTREHPWAHPPGRPYQIYGGPLGPDRMAISIAQVWTSERYIEGYELVEDDYSSRLYHIWRG